MKIITNLYSLHLYHATNCTCLTRLQNKKDTHDQKIHLPAFLAAWRSSSSIKCWAGSPSGNFSMKLSTWETTSSLLRYWYKPSDERIRNWSLWHNLWWHSEGEQDIYGAVPINSLRNISSTASFHFGYRNISSYNHVRMH